MNGFGLARAALRRSGKLVPLARVLVIAELAVEAGKHIAKLEPAERTRLLALLRRAKARPGRLPEHEREELYELVAKMQPQAFVAGAARRVSPVPVPRKLAERGASAAGRALSGRR